MVRRKIEKMLEECGWKYLPVRYIPGKLHGHYIMYIETMAYKFSITVTEEETPTMAGYGISKIKDHEDCYGVKRLGRGPLSNDMFTQILTGMLQVEMDSAIVVMRKGYVISMGNEPTKYVEKS